LPKPHLEGESDLSIPSRVVPEGAGQIIIPCFSAGFVECPSKTSEVLEISKNP
jgi:hypothetical protein